MRGSRTSRNRWTQPKAHYLMLELKEKIELQEVSVPRPHVPLCGPLWDQQMSGARSMSPRPDLISPRVPRGRRPQNGGALDDEWSLAGLGMG